MYTPIAKNSFSLPKFKINLIGKHTQVIKEKIVKDLQQLADQLMKLDDRIIACMKCGLCQAVCPIFGASMMEADVARGKLALVDNLAHRLIENPEAVAEKLGRCLLCGSCQANCPSGVQIIDVFLESREIVFTYLGLPTLKKIIFRKLLANPTAFNFATRMGASCQSLLFRKANNPQKTSRAPLLDKLLGSRYMRTLSKKPLHVSQGAINTPAGKSNIKVAFFPGCMGDKMYTDMSEACLKVLRHHGVGIYMPKGLTCCGIPAIASGDIPGMLAQTKSNLDKLAQEQFDYLITPCGSCTATIKEFWPRYAPRMEARESELVAKIAPKVMDINAFLINVLNVKPHDNATSQSTSKVTYHDPCHLKKSLGVSTEPRLVAQLNPKYSLIEMHEADRCCGCGGSFNLFHYDFSTQIGQRKRQNIVDSNADIVATACPACMMQLEDMLSQQGDSTQVKHCIELYAESLP